MGSRKLSKGQKKKWISIYNLADMIMNLNPKGLLHPEDSIVHRYLSSVDLPIQENAWGLMPSFTELDFDLLSGIVSSRTFETVPDDALALHVRVGDVFKIPKEKPPSPEEYASIISSNGLSESFDRCCIFYGNHTNLMVSASKRYLDELVTALEGLGMKCELVSNSVDDDFCALATAKNFLVGYRSFSWLAASINPNNVIWDLQDPPDFNTFPKSNHGKEADDKYRTLLRAGYTNHLRISKYV